MKFFEKLAVIVFYLSFCVVFAPAAYSQTVIIKPTRIYTSNIQQMEAEAAVIQGNKFAFVGTLDSAQRLFPSTPVQFISGYMYAGFIDAHCHFLGYSKMTLEANLIGANSPEKCVKILRRYYKSKNSIWILGRGWDQNLWKTGPSLAILDKAFGNKPVFLKRIDGHAAWINTAAIKLLNIDITKPISGGEYVMENGNFTGVLLDNAVEQIENQLPKPNAADLSNAVDKTTQTCLQLGLTGIVDAGLELDEINYLIKKQDQGQLPLYFQAMLNYSEKNLSYLSVNNMPSGNRLNSMALKIYIDGALGSHGALLKTPYADKASNGLQLVSYAQLQAAMSVAKSRNIQVCAHAIGDSAVSLFLNASEFFNKRYLDLRWRLEHCQVVSPLDIERIKTQKVIASVQPTHATSDASWALTRLGATRINHAYTYKSLVTACNTIALGTDFPVEPINPLGTFYSAVFRTSINAKLSTPAFMPEQAISRGQALLGMTYWAAYSVFMEKEIGSIEPEKIADFVILNTDLLLDSQKAIKKTKVLATYTDGKLRYKAN